jgi:hypothetical protein
LPVNPPDGATVAVYDVPAPATTVSETGVAEIVKSPPPPDVEFTANVATLLFSATTDPDEFSTVPCTVYVPVAEGVKLRLLWCVLPVDMVVLVEWVATTVPDEFTT